VSAGWVAAGVRARGLAQRRLGREATRRLAGSGSLAEAVEALTQTPYGHDVRTGMDLDEARHAVTATLTWHLRVLAGWGPAVELGGMRTLATVLEIDNITDHLLALSGQVTAPPLHLGGLGSAWGRVAGTKTPDDVRRVLATSAWGDPGATDAAAVRVALQLAWCRQVAEGVEPAARWAGGWAALVVAKLIAVNGIASLGPVPRRDARRVLGARWEKARTVAELATSAPRAASWVLLGIVDAAELWRAEARWWNALAEEGSSLLEGSRPGEASTVGTFGILFADAWRVRGALGAAAHGRSPDTEVLDALG